MKVWMASSSSTENLNYLNLAKEVANIFTENHFELVCGGIKSSMMKEIFEEFQKQNLSTTVVTLTCYNEDLSKANNTYLVSSTFERTKKLYELADILVFLPGGTGSLSEIFSSLEEYRTIDQLKQIIIYNYKGFYDPIISLIERLIKEGFNDEGVIKKLIVVNNLKELKMKVSEENE